VASQKFVEKIERGTSPTVREGSAFFVEKIERGTSPTVREGSAFLRH
jgi:hypothetical protein